MADVFLQWRGRLYANLLASVHLVDSEFIGDWLYGSSFRSAKDLKVNSNSKFSYYSNQNNKQTEQKTSLNTKPNHSKITIYGKTSQLSQSE